jgi:tetratricopeptide (TPR) repeat protein
MQSAGYLVVPVRAAGLRWGACALVLAAVAWGVVEAGRTAVAETVLFVATQYPLPPQALTRAYTLDPANPDAAYRLGLYHMDFAAPPDYDAAGRFLAESLHYGPKRLQTWLALGRHREVTGDLEQAEAAYRQAAALAPAYWRPQWALGNLYIRQGRIEEGVEALGAAADRYGEIARLGIQTVWRATGGDLRATTRAAGTRLYGRSALLDFLLAEKRVDDALPVWAALAREHPGDPAVVSHGQALAPALLAAGRAEEAIAVWSTIAPEAAAEPGRISNAGFEEAVAERAASPFVWTVTQSSAARASVDAGRSGGKALRVDYAVQSGEAASHASQFVRVRPGGAYTLVFWARTADLQSGGLPFVSVGDAAGREGPGSRQTLPLGTSEWTEYRVGFTAPANGLVSVRVGRESCGEVCPIFGTIWIDDLALVAS